MGNEKLIAAAVSAAIQLIEFLVAARAAGKLSDVDLDALTRKTNQATRDLIRKALEVPLEPTAPTAPTE